MSSLDFSIAPELCSRLEQLYIYIIEQLTISNLELKTEPLDVVVELLKTLRDDWSEVTLTSLPANPTVGRGPRQVTRPRHPTTRRVQG